MVSLPHQERVSTDSLVLEMRPKIRAWIRHNQRGRGDWEDLEQAAMVALVGAARRYDPALEKWSSYAWPRAIGAIYDEVRRSRPHGYRRPTRLIPGEKTPVTVSGDQPASRGEEDPTTIIEAIAAPPVADGEGYRTLMAAIRQLPVEVFSIVDLVILQDRRPSDIAKLLGLSDSAISWTLRKARTLLAEMTGRIDPLPVPRTRTSP